MSEERKMGHVQPFKNYLYTFMALLALTVITVLASRIHFKPHLWNDVAAVGIAGIKASLVTLFFMHGRYEGRLTWAFGYYPVILLLLLLGAVFLDYGFRGDENRVHQQVTIATGAAHEAHDSSADHHEPAAGQAEEHGDALGQESPAGAETETDHQQAEPALEGEPAPEQQPPPEEGSGGHG